MIYTNIYKSCKLHWPIIIFGILQYFAIKLCTFINSKMSYRDIVKYFVFLSLYIDQMFVDNANHPFPILLRFFQLIFGKDM